MGSLNVIYDCAIQYWQKGDKLRAIVTFEECRDLNKKTGVKDSELCAEVSLSLITLYSEKGNLDKAESLRKEFESLKIEERRKNVLEKIALAKITIYGDRYRSFIFKFQILLTCNHYRIF